METDNNYTATDIQRYLDGSMTPQEMNRLEKAALDDPFLAEAIEGYQSVTKESREKTLTELRETFAQKAQPAKVVPLNKRKNYWWQAAAAVFILAAGVTVYYQLTKKAPVDTAYVNKNEIPVVSAATDSFTVIPGNGAYANTELLKADSAGIANRSASADYKNKTKTYVVTTSPPNSVAAGTTTFLNNTLPDKTDAVQTTPVIAAAEADKIVTESKQAELPPAGNEKKEVMKTEAAKPAPAADNAARFKNFYATVQATDGSPLPFANINLRNEGIGTYADNNGVFRLISQDSVLLVDVKSVGYEPVTYRLSSNVANNKIVLQEPGRAEGVVAMNDNIKRKARSENFAAIRTPKVYKDSALVNAEPADGWDSYNTYVANNLNLDDISPKDKRQQHGEAEITFDVQSNGTITNIQVDPVNCDNCTDAARKLIQEGPQWKVTKGKTGKVKLKLKF